MVVTSDLQVNRRFLDSRFQGYKLDNSKDLPTFSREIPVEIDLVHPSDEQYSYIQQREFSIHNHLYSDPWNPSDVYFVDSSKNILKVTAFEDGMSGLIEVWNIPFPKPRIPGHYNVTISFASPEMVVVSNGAGYIYILSTLLRSSSNKWKELHCETVPDGIRLADARSPSLDVVHILYCNVDSKESHVTYLQFLIDGEKFNKSQSTAILSGKGTIDYVAFNETCETACIIGQIEVNLPEGKVTEERREVSFEWQQNFNEIKVWISHFGDGEPNITVTSTSLLILSSQGDTLLEGEFLRPVEDGLSTWQFIQRDGKKTLELVLSKSDEGSMWNCLFDSSNYFGKEIPDEDVVADIHNKLAHLTSETQDVGGATVLNSGQLEECDIADSEGRVLLFCDLKSPSVPKSKINLGNGQWLMSGPRTTCDPPIFVLRADVDGIVWALSSDGPKHVSTLCAFGYVQASKTSRVFSFIPSDHSYAGIVDADGRVFIYTGGNRPSGRSEWGTQYLVYLKKIKAFGIHATKENIFILDKKTLYTIQLKC